MEKHNKYLVILAALLHDIGKIRWDSESRSADPTKASSDFFDAAFSGQSEAMAVKNEVLSLLKGGENPILDVVSRADQIEKDHSGSEAGFKRKPLLSVLSLIETVHDRPKGLWYYKPGMVSTVDINPSHAENINNLPDDSEMSKLSDEVYTRLVDDVRSLPDLELPQLIESLLFLFEKHLTMVSSSVYLSKPDISLFDHLKTTAALAACINEAESDENPFLIVAADVSGIQNFIYSETNPVENRQKGRSKQFRGKSFYLTLLTDTFSSYLLRETGMLSANLLINGGGHFVLVVPNNSSNREKMSEARKNIQKWFYRTYKGELNLILETLEANATLYKDFSKWYGVIATKLTAAKKQRSIGFLGEAFSIDLDSAAPQYAAIPSSEDKAEYEKMNDYEKFLFSLTQMFEDLGSVLPKARYIVKREIPTDYRPKKRYESGLVEIPFKDFGLSWVIASDKELATAYLKEDSETHVVLYCVNEFEVLKGIVPEKGAKNTAYGVRLIGNYAPLQSDTGSVMEFPELAVLNSETGDKLNYSVLSVLRMDVDNLGSIFSFGLERNDEQESIRSLSRTVNLSRALNLFFTGHINILAEKWQIYVTYSGGDDLFVVGSWINVLNFAFDLKEAFTQYACGNRNLTISAGAYLCRESYPVHRAANHAGAAESRAKKSSPEKDSISIFGREFKWTRAKDLIDYGREIDSLVASKNPNEEVTSAYVHFLLGQTTEMLNEKNELVIEKYFRNMFKIKYSLARNPRGVNAEAIKDNKEGRKPNKKVALFSRLVNSEESTGLIQDFVVPASYVILKNRTKK
ncbi:MAG: hypothetical protein AMXMBFR49_28800 [Chlorobiota bacterium]|nr:MAG: type III-A CRISPR-associated protein Cas10/Csm1 [Chlorobiota bacterium]